MDDLRKPDPVKAWHALALGALLALCALAPAILPYGGRYVTRGDLIEQQLPFLAETRRLLRGNPFGYSFSTFLGTGAVSGYAFYTLGSPFVWPLALLPQAALPYAVSAMAVAKHAVCMLCAFLYLRRMLQSGRLALLGAALYTFSSFTVVNTQFYHFTEVVAFFPLILLGMEDAMGDAPHPGALALACGLNALTNYYFMFSSALLAALYFACRLFSADWASARTPRRVLLALFECAAGCALAGALLLPAARAMLSITRTGAGDVPLLARRYTLSTLLERLRALLMPIESGVVHAVYGDTPSWSSTAAYLPVFGLTGAVAFMTMPRGKRGERRPGGWLRALLALLAVASAVPALCGLFALETNTAYTRWWYGLAMALTLATLYALRGATLQTWRRAFAACVAACCLLLLPALPTQGMLDAMRSAGGPLARVAAFCQNRRTGAYAPLALRVLAPALALLGGGAMLALLARRLRPRAALALVCAVACVQYTAYIAVGDRALLSGGEAPGEGVYTLRELAEPTLSALALPEEDGGGYVRIDHGDMLRNYGLLLGRSSLTSFSSLRTSAVGRFVEMAGFGYDESTTVKPPDGGEALRVYLSVSEYHQLCGESMPDGYVYDREENGFPVYVNPDALPMGFLKTCVTGTHDQPMSGDALPATLLAAAALDADALARWDGLLPRLDVYAIPDWRESAARLRENACDRFEVSPSGFTAHIDAKEAGLLVFTIPYDKGFSATVDGRAAEIVPCDVAFMAVYVEPGEHEIAFAYRTRGLAAGVALSLFSAAALGAYVLLRRRGKIAI